MRVMFPAIAMLVLLEGDVVHLHMKVFVEPGPSSVGFLVGISWIPLPWFINAKVETPRDPESSRWIPSLIYDGPGVIHTHFFRQL